MSRPWKGAYVVLFSLSALIAQSSLLFAQDTSTPTPTIPPTPPETSTPPLSEAWYDGVIEGNFVVLSIFVGIVVFLAALYLMRRLIPPRAGGIS